jgi:hypothetical protein
MILCCAAALLACAQDVPPAPQSPESQVPQSLDRTPATLHGIVRNAVTGEGVPRALVSIEGDAETGALTDGDGRFEIDGVPVGPQAVDVSKPGFFSPAFAGSAEAPSGVSGPPHNVLVAASMPDVVFTLAPACTIRGRVDLSTGDPAEGIEVGLVRRIITDGRAVWQASGFTKTRSDGTYRFGGLAAGQYVLYTSPALDSDPYSTLVASGKAAAAQRWGYASIYYPDARDPSGASIIPVTNGAEVQANLTLTREPFQTVTVALPQSGAVRAQTNYSAELADGSGHPLPYPTQYDSNAHAFQAALPDGTYSILVTSTSPLQRLELESGAHSISMPSSNSMQAGELGFTVAGQPIANLRVPLAPVAPALIQINVIRSGAAALTGNEQIAVLLSPTGGVTGTTIVWIGTGVMGQYANGTTDGPLQANYMDPGQYWAHTFVAGRGLCESSFTAGGASLGREPLTIGVTGQTAPMELTLRDDCARLALSLPQDLMETGAGEEKFYTVYVVPDFDFTWDITPVILRPSSGGSFTLTNLTPGSYHVYIFEGNANLEYRNPAALAVLSNQGQAVTLSPGASANLVLEAPAR